MLERFERQCHLLFSKALQDQMFRTLGMAWNVPINSFSNGPFPTRSCLPISCCKQCNPLFYTTSAIDKVDCHF